MTTHQFTMRDAERRADQVRAARLEALLEFHQWNELAAADNSDDRTNLDLASWRSTACGIATSTPSRT